MPAATSKAARRLWLGLCLALCAILTSGCLTLTDPESAQVHASEIVAAAQAGPPPASLGQSFVSRRAGLNGITLWANPPASTQAQAIQVSLYHLDTGAPVYSATLNLQGEVLHLALPPLNDPAGQSYYLRLQPLAGSLQLKGRNDNIYAQGTAFLSDQPLPADLAFQTSYRYTARALLADLPDLLAQAWLLLPLGAALLLPGWWLLRLALPERPVDDFWQRLALACGLSLALIPLLMLWSSSLGLAWNQAVLRWLAWLAGLAALLALTGDFLRRGLPSGWRRRLPHHLAVLLVLAGSVLVRALMMRDLSAPAWVDSYHHALLGRLLLEQGGFPANLSPYLALQTSDYHLGFHSGLALFAWLSGLELPQALLVYGQAQNLLTVLAAYALTFSLSHERSAGLAAALFTGLVSPMPAYYVSWGRYPHLSGLLIMAALLALLTQLARTGSKPTALRLALLAGLAAAGLVLTHYVISAFAAALALAYALVYLLARQRPNLKALGWYALAALLALIFSAAWLAPALNNSILPGAAVSAQRPAWFSDFTWRHLTAGEGHWLLAFAWLGLALSLWRRPRFGLTLALWLGLLLVLGNLRALGWPGGRYFNLMTVFISLFLPLSALAGWACAQAAQALQSLLQTRMKPALAQRLNGLLSFTVLLALGVQGGLALPPLFNSGTALLRQGDLAAAAWVRDNLPPGETVAVNAFLWGYGLYAPADGGGWLPALSLHPTLPPPVLYGFSARPERLRINQTLAALQAAANEPAQIAALLQAQQVRYLYLGGRGGAFSPRLLQADPHFRLLYSQDGVTIFEIVALQP